MTFLGGQIMTNQRRPAALRRLLSAAAIAAGLALLPALPAMAQSTSTVSLPMGASQTLSLGYHKSKIIDLPKAARDVIVSDPRIATAVLRDSRRIFLTGVTVGQADLFVLDQNGQQILHLALLVERDTAALQTMIRRLIPDSNIHVELMNDNIVLTGTVKNAGDANKAQQLATMFANGSQNTGVTASGDSGGPSSAGGTGAGVASDAGKTLMDSKVLNLLTIEGEDQVQLKVTVAEINRDVAKQLGVNITAVGGQIAALATNNPFAIAGPLFSPANRAIVASAGSGSGFAAELQAMEQDGSARVLAEFRIEAEQRVEPEKGLSGFRRTGHETDDQDQGDHAAEIAEPPGDVGNFAELVGRHQARHHGIVEDDREFCRHRSEREEQDGEPEARSGSGEP